MQIRPFDAEKDYEEVAKWWKEQNWPPIPVDVLSSTGFIAENAQGKLAATWIYTMNSPVFLMEWTVGNPEAHHTVRKEALKLVTSSACKFAKENGARQVFTMTKHDRFIKKLEEYGFQKTDSGMTHLVRSL